MENFGMKNLILAPKDTKIEVGSNVLVWTGVHNPLVAEVEHINEHSKLCTLKIKDNFDSRLHRYVEELKPLMYDKTPILGEILQQSGKGDSQYDWVKTVETIYEPKEMCIEITISHLEYHLRRRIQTFKENLSVEQRSDFLKLIQNWGDFNREDAEKRAAEDAAGEDL